LDFLLFLAPQDGQFKESNSIPQLGQKFKSSAIASPQPGQIIISPI
jgi:hypothetical protein